jgi:hypothetical protein
MKAQSYDPRMEKLPLFISYPRSGSNWVNCVMELYFDRPRLRDGPVTFLKDRDKRKDYMWFHDHDIFSDLVVGHNNVIYLYRNPVDVIFSKLMAEKKSIMEIDINHECSLLRNNLTKYLLSEFKAKTFIYYGTLKRGDYYSEFEKFIKFFDKEATVDRVKLDKAIRMVKKQDVIDKEVDKRYFSKKLLSQDYRAKKLQFIKKYHDRINNAVVGDWLIGFFKGDV